MFSNSFYFFRSEFSEIPLWIKIVQLISLIAVWLIIKKHSFSRWFWIPIILTFPVIGTILWILFSAFFGQIYENLLRKMKFVLKSIMCDP